MVSRKAVTWSGVCLVFQSTDLIEVIEALFVASRLQLCSLLFGTQYRTDYYRYSHRPTFPYEWKQLTGMWTLVVFMSDINRNRVLFCALLMIVPVTL